VFTKPNCTEGECAPPFGAVSVKAHCLPFSQIPHTSALFTDFLAFSSKVQSFYSRPPYFSEWLNEEAKKVQYDAPRREQVTRILEHQNKSWKASQKTLENLERLRNGAAAVVTGQQVGLFGGPTFSIYKALTAVKLAEQATAAGIDTVPIFWLATYDHDLAEVNHISLPGSDGTLLKITVPSHDGPGAPVSNVRLGDEIVPALDEAAAVLGDTEATTFLRETYSAAETLGTAFARLYARLFADWGVIVLDASDGELHRIARPIYRAAIEQAPALTKALLARGAELEAAGYHQQVKVTSSSSLLFKLHHGARTAIHLHGEGDQAHFVIGDEKLSAADLLSQLESQPEQFSPNVLLRPVVEDYLLPTLAYTGGAAETAYFAQSAVVFESLLERVTPMIPRYSATLVEPKIQRLLDRYDLSVTDTFGGPEAIRQKLAAHSLPDDLQAGFEAAKKSIDAQLSAIKEKLAKLDRTLVDAGDTAVSKIQYQLERLHTQAARAEAQKSELIQRHAETLSTALFPEKGLQERTIGGVYFMARYGRDLLHQIYETMQADCHDHQIVELGTT
jgi:bacillithiol biosynthesis cysteine-adding enzyme BshC